MAERIDSPMVSSPSDKPGCHCRWDGKRRHCACFMVLGCRGKCRQLIPEAGVPA